MTRREWDGRTLRKPPPFISRIVIGIIVLAVILIATRA